MNSHFLSSFDRNNALGRRRIVVSLNKRGKSAFSRIHNRNNQSNKTKTLWIEGNYYADEAADRENVIEIESDTPPPKRKTKFGDPNNPALTTVDVMSSTGSSTQKANKAVKNAVQSSRGTTTT